MRVCWTSTFGGQEPANRSSQNCCVAYSSWKVEAPAFVADGASIHAVETVQKPLVNVGNKQWLHCKYGQHASHVKAIIASQSGELTCMETGVQDFLHTRPRPSAITLRTSFILRRRTPPHAAATPSSGPAAAAPTGEGGGCCTDAARGLEDVEVTHLYVR